MTFKNKILEKNILKFIQLHPAHTSYGIGYRLDLGDYDIQEGELNEILGEMVRAKLIERKFESSKDGEEFGARYYPVIKS